MGTTTLAGKPLDLRSDLGEVRTPMLDKIYG